MGGEIASLPDPLGEPQARYFRAWRLFLSATDDKDPQLQDAAA